MKMVKGMVKKISRGFTTAFRKESTAASTRASHGFLSVIPGKRFAVTKMANVERQSLRMNFIEIRFNHVNIVKDKQP